MLSRQQEAPQQILHPVGNKKGGEAQKSLAVRVLHSAVLLDCIAVFFLSAGVCAAFLPTTIVDGSLAGWLVIVALSVLSLAVLRIRWWLGPAIALACSVIMLLRFYFTNALATNYEWMLELAEWLWQNAPGYEDYVGTRLILAVKCVMIFSATTGIFIMVRRFFSVLLAVAVMGGVLLAAEYFGDYDLILPIALYAIGVIALFPRVYGKAIRKRDSRHVSIQLIALPGAVIVTLLAAAITPQDTSDIYSKSLAYMLYDVGYMFNGPMQVYVENQSNFGLEAVGFQQQTERLGGPVQLRDWHMLTVISEKPLLLRGAVMDTYTGERWINTGFDGDYRYQSPIWRRNRAEAFGLELPLGGDEAEKLYESLTDKITMQVIYELRYYTTLFTAGRLTALDFSSRDLYAEAFYNMRSELYLSLPVPQGELVTMQTRVFRPFLGEDAQGFAKLEALASTTKDPEYDDLVKRYTALPESLPAEVAETAELVAAGAETPYLKALEIAQWLGEACSYTINPPPLPDEQDFVWHFIQTREGYCTYFASAMVVMARSQGIPARYVTGFALERDSSRENTFVATGKTAHAWTELYFSGIGWVTFDPLYWNADEPLNSVQEEQAPIIPSYYYEDEEEPGEQVFISDWRPNTDDVNINLTPYWISLAAIAVGAFVVYLIRAWGSKYRRYELGAVTRKYSSVADCFAYYYSDIITQLALLQLPARPAETLLHYPARVDSQLDLQKPNFSDVATAQMRVNFAGKEPSSDELKAAAEYHKRLEDLLRKRYSALVYMIKRAVRN